MAPRPPSAVTRFVYLATFLAIVVIATLSVITYRSAVAAAIQQDSNQQLALLRTAAVGMQGEIQAMSTRIRQFGSMPSVQNLDVDVLSQRVNAAFGEDESGLVTLIGRADADGKLYVWTSKGNLLVKGTINYRDPELWAWASNRANATTIRMVHPFSNGQSPRRAIVIPVWRNAPSAEVPKPRNDFNGVLALNIDLNRMMQVYLGPAMTEMSGSRLVVGLATPQFGVRMGPDNADMQPTPAEAHNHVEPQGTTILSDKDGRRLHAWSKLNAADETWLVASSTPYALIAGRLQQSAMAQLLLSSMLLIGVPLAGWLVLRRERHVQDEQRALERRLAESEKMEAIGKVAGGVAHDFNNMLTAILGYASMIQEDAPPRSAIRDQAMQIRRAAENAASLTQKLLAFSRKHVLQPGIVDLRSMLGNLLNLVRKAVGEDVHVTTQTGEDLWPILADQSHVEQSILNLVINAREAMPNGGTLQITVRNAPRPRGERRHDVDVKPGDYVQITVTDTGIGMDESTRARMFEPFFTTKAPGKGTGLGLSTVYGFVRQCGGYISVLSTPGKGTSIEVLLPRAEAPLSAGLPTPPSNVEGDGAPGRETVLIAEDEEGVRLLATESLERRGFHVLAADSGEAAIKLAMSYEGTIHVLLTDVVMPGMKGPELADRMRAMRPGIRVLLMSGYSADIVTPADLKEAALITKPFSPAALSKAVRAALDASLPSETA